METVLNDIQGRLFRIGYEVPKWTEEDIEKFKDLLTDAGLT